MIKAPQVSVTYAQAYADLGLIDADPKNPNNVILVYTGRSQNAVDTSCHSASGGNCWNREHTWPKSLGVGKDSSKAAYTDLYNLKASDMSVNSSRGNKKFGIVSPHDATTENSEAKGNYTNSTTWEPRDTIKGDTARVLFYMATRYDGTDSAADLTLSKDGNIGNVCTFLKWNKEDPVSDEEKKRDQLVYKYQKNKNPFVDDPSFAEKIWGSKCD